MGPDYLPVSIFYFLFVSVAGRNFNIKDKCYTSVLCSYSHPHFTPRLQSPQNKNHYDTKYKNEHKRGGWTEEKMREKQSMYWKHVSQWSSQRKGKTAAATQNQQN